MSKKCFQQFSWMRSLCVLVLSAALLLSLGTTAHAETASDMATFPTVSEYTATGGEFVFKDTSRFVVISNSQSLQNETLVNDLQLLSSEFTAVGLTDESMDIIFGSESTAAAGDIVIELNAPSEDVSPEAYTIVIGETAKVSAAGEAGIFYGVRTIQKTMLLNGSKLDCGTITDAPATEVRGFHLDNARKMFSKNWILALIKDLSYQNINTFQFHFSENEGYRLESSTLEAINGWTYPSDGYYTKADMLEIIKECQKYHIELVPSLDSPGHMSYVLGFLPDDWDCSSIWSESTDYRSVQTFNIFEKEECREFLAELFTEYAEFFSEAGCKHMNIGGDEFLNNFSSMTNNQYISVMNYFNEIAAIVKSYGLTPRAWNDGLLFKGFSGYQLDSDIEICYWSGPTGTATIADFIANGNKVINMSDAYMYYVLNSWWNTYVNASGQTIYNDWQPGKFPSSADSGSQILTYPYNDNFLGASYAVWCDNPEYMTEATVESNLFLRTRAMAEKSWNPTTTASYTNFQTTVNTLGRVPGYDGTDLPASGEVLYEGEFGVLTLRYVDTEGTPLKDDVTTYGLIDETYTITPDAIYGYRFVSMDKASEGSYTAEEIIVTLTYEQYIDKEALSEAVAGAVEANNYIPATYSEYETALETAKTVLENNQADQAQVDEALLALTEAQNGLIPLERTELYLEVEYPIAAAGYTAASYTAYQNALTAAETVLFNPEASASAVTEALNNVLTAKDGLALTPSGNFITVSSTDETYWVGSYPLSYTMDNNLSTFAWLADAQHAGDVVTYTFSKPVTLNSFRYQAPADAGTDIFSNAVVEISNDGSSWTQIGTLQNETDKTISAGGQTVSYVRIRVVSGADPWVKIAEVTLDYVENDTIDKTALETALTNARALTEDEYTSASWTVLASALAKAEAVLTNEGATAGEIAAAKTALTASIEALQEAPAEPEEPDIPVEKPSVTEVFNDIEAGKWYIDAVQYVYDNGIMSGNNGLFNPNGNVTRAQVVTTLYNMEGRPEVTDFSACEDLIDVQTGKWYTDAVCWAYNAEVANGNSSTKMFNMNSPVTRQQLATFFFNYATYKEMDTTVRGDYSELKGADEVASYAAETMQWAYGTGLITGSKTTVNGETVYDLNPKGTATRVQLASILQRFCE